MHEGQLESRFESLSLRVSTRFNYILFPTDLSDILKALSRQGYAPAGALPPEPYFGGPDAGLTGKGQIALKGDSIVDFDGDKQFIGFSGDQPEELVDTMFRFLEDMRTIWDHSHIMFYELQARSRVFTRKSPMNIVAATGVKADLVREASKAFERSMSLFSAKLVWAPEGPSSPRFLEVWCQPAIRRSETILGFSTVFRTPERDEFRQFVVELNDNLRQFADSIGAS